MPAIRIKANAYCIRQLKERLGHHPIREIRAMRRKGMPDDEIAYALRAQTGVKISPSRVRQLRHEHGVDHPPKQREALRSEEQAPEPPAKVI